MSQQINDNFQLLAGIPIDDRNAKPTISARDAISSTRRFQGLLCFVEQTQTLYQLRGGILNSNWVGIAGNDISNGLETIIEGFYVLSAGKETLLDWEVGDKFRGWIANRYVVGTILSLPVSLPSDIDNALKVELAVDSDGFTFDIPTVTEAEYIATVDTYGSIAKIDPVNLPISNTSKTQNRNELYNNLCQIVGDELYISSKYGTSNDWLCVFKKCMFNELYTFSRVGIIANAGVNPDPTKLLSTPTTILNEVGSDNIGPVNITTYGFIGGNHSLGNDGVTKTAINVSYDIYLDGVLLNDTNMHSFNEMKILVVNTIYDPATMPTLTGLITESVTYIVKGGSIDVSVNHDYLKNISIVQYYGMQSNYSTAYTHLYFGNSQYNDRIMDYGIGVDADSGSRTTYPDVDKIVLSNSSKTNVQSMLLNTNVGLGKNRIAYVTSDPLAFSTGKEYFRLIMGQAFTAGTSNHWAGSYTWYNQSETGATLHANTIFAYPTLRGGETVYTIDTKGTVNQDYPIFEAQGKDIAGIKKKETTVVAYLGLKNGANVITSGSDNIIFQQGKGISNFVKNTADRIVNGEVGFLPKIAGGKILNQSSLFEDISGNVSLGITTPLTGGGGLKWFSSNGFITAFSGVVKAYNYADDLFQYLLTGAGIGYKIQVNNGVDALTVNSDTTIEVDSLSGTGTRQVVADADGKLSADTIQPLKYVALLNQTGTGAPVATVIENTLGGSIVWSRLGLGSYQGVLTGAFTSAKTVVFCTKQKTGLAGVVMAASRVDNDTVGITTSTQLQYWDDELVNASIEIRVYL